MFRSSIDRRLVTLTATASMEAEQYQALRLKLEHLQRERNIHVIGVTSPGARDGKTVTAINLAAALSEGSNARVLLIEADLRRPAVSRYLGLRDVSKPGLAELVLDEKLQLPDAIERHEHVAFDTMVAGAADTPVHQIFRMPRLQALLTELRQRYDFVIIDTPPVGPVSDCALLARWTCWKAHPSSASSSTATTRLAPATGAITVATFRAPAGARPHQSTSTHT